MSGKKDGKMLLAKLGAIISCFGMSLTACGGGSSGGGTASRPSLTTSQVPVTTASLSDPALGYLFDDIPDFEDGSRQALAIDVVTGQVTSFQTGLDLKRFLNKQPDPHDNRLFIGSDKTAFVGLSHLAHNLDDTRFTASFERFQLGDVNQRDAGHFFLFGKAHDAPAPQPHYDVKSAYFCSHCARPFDTANGTLRFTINGENRAKGLLSLANDEISLTVPLSLTQNRLSLDQLSDQLSFSKNGITQTITNAHNEGYFFGAQSQEVGVLLSLEQTEGVFSAGAIGKSR